MPSTVNKDIRTTDYVINDRWSMNKIEVKADHHEFILKLNSLIIALTVRSENIN